LAYPIKTFRNELESAFGVAAGFATGRAIVCDRITELTILRLFVGERSGLFEPTQENTEESKFRA